MTTVSISPKFQVVIPKEIRRRHGIRAGQRVQFLDLGDRIVIVPLLEPKELRGSLKSKTPFKREPDREIASPVAMSQGIKLHATGDFASN